MKKNILLIICLFFILEISFAQKRVEKKVAAPSLWYSSAAKTLQPKRVESGLFAPTRLGFKNNYELSVHPIWFFVMPNARLKKNWTLDTNKKWQIASEHGFTFPTILLNILAKKGTAGILPASQKVPPILTLKNRLVASYYYHKNHAVSLRAGIEFNVLQSLYTDFAPIELYFIYPRTATYHNFYTGEVSLAFSGIFANRVGYDGDLKLFLIPDDKLTWVFEWNPKLYYHFSNNFRIMAGALFTTGNIPHEKVRFRAIPVLDLQFSFAKRKSKPKK